MREFTIRRLRRAAIWRAPISTLVGHSIANDAAAALPDLNAAVAEARRGLDSLRARPEYQQFDRSRDRVTRQQELSEASDRPQVSAYGRAGYGRPGLNFI